jgi:GNAT superfamily N-acetyltransferase
LTIRLAGAADAEAIAHLHATSWRIAYRGILSNEFLAGPVFANRLELWKGRLVDPPPLDQVVVLDEEAGEMQGFACAFFDADPDWGALLDNLHVAPNLKGKGLGRLLMADVARRVLQHDSSSRLHLWAYEANVGAQRFYERLGGQATAVVSELAPDGAHVNAVRYCWSDLSGLARI